MFNPLTVFKKKSTFSILIILISSVIAALSVMNEKLYILLLLMFIILITIKPVIGLIFSVLLDGWFSYMDLLGFPPRNYVIAYLFLIFILTILVKKDVYYAEYEKIKIFYKLFACFILLSMIVNIVNGRNMENAMLHMIARQIMPLAISMLILYWINNKKKIKIFLYFSIIVVAISAFVGIMQFFGSDFFWELRLMIPGPENIPGMELDLFKSRIAGLAYFAVPLSYQLSFLLPLVLSLILQKNNNRLEKTFLITVFVVMTATVFMTLVRSAIIGVMVGFVAVTYLSEIKKKFINVTLIIVLCLSVFYLSDVIFDRFTYMDESTYGRIPLAIAGLKMALMHPFGIGEGNYQFAASDMYYELSHLPGSEYMLVTSAHNQFINVLVSYGFAGLILLIIFYVLLFRELLKAGTCEDGFLNSFRTGVIGAFISYTVNSLFHNAGMFYSDVFIWYFIGLAFVCIKLFHMHDSWRGASHA